MLVYVTKTVSILAGLCLLLSTRDLAAERLTAILLQHSTASHSAAPSAPARSAPARQQPAQARQQAPVRRPALVVVKPAPVAAPNQQRYGSTQRRTPSPSPRPGPMQNPSSRQPAPVNPFPQPHPGPPATPAQIRTDLRITSRQDTQSAAENELNARRATQPYARAEFHQHALAGYQLAVDHLQQTRNTQEAAGTHFAPSTDIPLATSHLGAARVLFLLDRPKEAQLQVQSSEQLLRDLLTHQEPSTPMNPGWLWRVDYLLGDISLYENHPSIALYYYQQAQAINPDFAPTSAMTQCLGDPTCALQLSTGSTPTAINFVAAPPFTAPLIAAPPIAVPPIAQAPITQPAVSQIAIVPAVATPTPQTAPVNPLPAPAPQPAAIVSRPAPQTPSPQPTSAPAQTQDTSTALYQQMKQLSASQALSRIGTVASFIAQVFEITELGPIASAITVAGMIVDYTVKP